MIFIMASGPLGDKWVDSVLRLAKGFRRLGPLSLSLTIWLEIFHDIIVAHMPFRVNGLKLPLKVYAQKHLHFSF